ncbi:MAG: hypothetical protein IT282_04695 [Bacteroidetes bacterium]|nr:hypothetical protein [Bacteroidota bacterium]
MKAMRQFTLQVGIVFAVSVLCAAYPMHRYASDEVITAALTGALLSTVNVLAGFLAIQLTLDKSYTTFLKAVLGGMGIRMAGMLGMLLVLILVAHMHAVALTVTVVGYSMVYLVLEIVFLQKMLQVKNQG